MFTLARAGHIFIDGSLLSAKRAISPDRDKKVTFDRAISRSMRALRPHAAV
jgi:hypothetical protein